MSLNITATPITAALAGAFSAAVWPLLWSRFGGEGGDSAGLVIATLLAIALPAHLFVVGLGRAGQDASRTLDTALLRRIGAWLAAAAAVAAVQSLT